MLQTKRRILAMLTVFAMLCSVFYTDGAAFVQAKEQETSQKENAKESAATERIRRISRAAEEGEGDGDDFQEGYYGYILSDDEFAGFMAEDTGAGTDWLETEIFNENLDSLLAELEASESTTHNYWIGCSLENEQALNIEIPSSVKNIGFTALGVSVKLDRLTLGENTEQALLEGSFTGSEHILTLDYVKAPEGKVGLRYASIEGFICADGDEPSGTLTLQDWNSVEGIDNIATLELLPFRVHERDEEGNIIDADEVWDTGWNLEIRGKDTTAPIVFNDIICSTEDGYTEGNFSIQTEQQTDGSFRLPVFNGTIDLGSYYNQDDDEVYSKNISLRVIEDMDVDGDWQTVGPETGTQVAVLAEDVAASYLQAGNIRYDGYEDDQHGWIEMDGSFLKDGEALFYVERLSEEEFNGTAEEWNPEWIGDAGSFESALALVDGESRLVEECSGLYKIGLGDGIYGVEDTIELGSLDLTQFENVWGLRIEGERWDEEENVFRPDFHLNDVNLGAGQSLLLAGIRCISMEEEAQPQEDPIAVTGEGTLILDTCRMYQAVEAPAGDEMTIEARYSNTVSILKADNVVLHEGSSLTVGESLEAENLIQEAYGALLFLPEASASIGNMTGTEEAFGIEFTIGYCWEDGEEAWRYPQISIGDIQAGEGSWLQITPYSLNDAEDRGYTAAEDVYYWEYEPYGTEERPGSIHDCHMGPEDLSGNILTLGTDAESFDRILKSDLYMVIACSYCSMELDMDSGIHTGGNPSGLYLSADSEPVAWVPFVVSEIDMDHAEVETIPDKEYTGEQIRPEVVVTMDGEPLTEGEDYTLVYENNVEVGTAKVIIRSTEESRYYGEKIVEFTIKKTEQPSTEQPGTEQPGTEKPGTEQPGTNPQPVQPIANPVPAKGTASVAGSFKVKVTVSSADGGEVTVTGTKNKKLTSAVIPATVTINGYTFKVTEISKNAFKGCTKLKKVTIGKNVKTIGASAFSGCKSLKTITIKSKVLKKVGKAAFKGIYAKAKIKVPKAKLKAYKKLLKGKGQKSTVKITK